MSGRLAFVIAVLVVLSGAFAAKPGRGYIMGSVEDQSADGSIFIVSELPNFSNARIAIRHNTTVDRRFGDINVGARVVVTYKWLAEGAPVADHVRVLRQP